jgi:hypothetical protein
MCFITSSLSTTYSSVCHDKLSTCIGVCVKEAIVIYKFKFLLRWQLDWKILHFSYNIFSLESFRDMYGTKIHITELKSWVMLSCSDVVG